MLSVEACAAAIRRHSADLARAAEQDLQAGVRHCPGWSMADLVTHISGVHWFWTTIVAERLQEPPRDRPEHSADVAAFEAGAERLVSTLLAADQQARVWTWAPGHQHVAFVTRHQVQEAAVHAFDAMTAVGLPWSVDAGVAADCVDEFLTVSVSTEDDPWDPPRPALGGTLGLRCTDLDAAWTVTDATTPGTVRVTPGAPSAGPVVEAPAADLLLWLYDRRELEAADPVVDRFRALRFLD